MVTEGRERFCLQGHFNEQTAVSSAQLWLPSGGFLRLLSTELLFSLNHRHRIAYTDALLTVIRAVPELTT